jgi:hypothetical protein
LTVFILALGIGATTAIFSAVNPILFKSLPYPEASRIMTIWGLRRDGSLNEGAFGAFHEISQRTHSFETLAAIRSWLPTITSEDEPERFKGQRVSADYFRVLGVAPSIGRDFRADEDKPNGSNVAVLSDALWRRRFSSNPAIVGTDITLDGNIYSVIGIMPATFENVAAPDAEIWTTLQYDLSQGLGPSSAIAGAAAYQRQHGSGVPGTQRTLAGAVERASKRVIQRSPCSLFVTGPCHSGCAAGASCRHGVRCSTFGDRDFERHQSASRKRRPAAG